MARSAPKSRSADKTTRRVQPVTLAIAGKLQPPAVLTNKADHIGSLDFDPQSSAKRCRGHGVRGTWPKLLNCARRFGGHPMIQDYFQHP